MRINQRGWCSGWLSVACFVALGCSSCSETHTANNNGGAGANSTAGDAGSAAADGIVGDGGASASSGVSEQGGASEAQNGGASGKGIVDVAAGAGEGGALSGGASGQADGGDGGRAGSDGTSTGGVSDQAGAGGAPFGVNTCVKRDDGCDLDSDCTKGSFCVDWRCKLGSALNEPCLAGCQQGLVCSVASMCTAPTLLCTPPFGCLDGYRCQYVVNNDACHAIGALSCNMCVLIGPVSVGGRCTSDSECAPADYCDLTYVPAPFCVPRHAEKAQCTLGTSACAADLYCSTMGATACGSLPLPPCTVGTCQRTPGVGEACGSGSVCAGSLVCDAITQLCRQRSNGDECVANACPDGLYCDGSRCRAEAGEGDACAPGECQPGLYCPAKGSTCIPLGPYCNYGTDCRTHENCVHQRCQTAPGPNQPCFPGCGSANQACCAAGLVCSVGICLPPPEDGPDFCLAQPCAEGLVCEYLRDNRCAPKELCALCGVPNPSVAYCNSDPECGEDGRCVHGGCQTARAEGAACSDNFPCRVDSYCANPDSVCKSLPIVGQACVNGVEMLNCASSYCDQGSGICASYPAPGTPCREGRCREDSYCDRGLCQRRINQGAVCDPRMDSCAPGLVCPGSSAN